MRECWNPRSDYYAYRKNYAKVTRRVSVVIVVILISVINLELEIRKPFVNYRHLALTSITGLRDPAFSLRISATLWVIDLTLTADELTAKAHDNSPIFDARDLRM